MSDYINELEDDEDTINDTYDTAEEPVAEEPVVEEPVAEEPVVEEPVAEEPVVVENIVAEKKTESIFVPVQKFRVKNKMSQLINLVNGDVILKNGSIVVKEKTEQLLTLEKRGFVSISKI